MFTSVHIFKFREGFPCGHDRARPITSRPLSSCKHRQHLVASDTDILGNGSIYCFPAAPVECSAQDWCNSMTFTPEQMQSMFGDSADEARRIDEQRRAAIKRAAADQSVFGARLEQVKDASSARQSTLEETIDAMKRMETSLRCEPIS